MYVFNLTSSRTTDLKVCRDLGGTSGHEKSQINSEDGL